jgi:hypothetical protein
MMRRTPEFERIPYISLDLARIAARDQEERVVKLLTRGMI